MNRWKDTMYSRKSWIQKRSYPNSRALDVYKEAEELLEEEPHVEFSGEVEIEFEYLSEDGKIQGWERKCGNISSQDL
ncbi:hypothetical protein C5167_029925 [Papaver somniferum]|nr:hypothetical protein C5167_029925 [Papaver somniferum]